MVIGVIVVDDHPMVLRGTIEMIEEAPDLKVVASGRDGDEALELALRHRPDVLMLDVQMPRRDGIEVVRELRRQDQRVGVVILSAADDEGTILRALQAGANGYLLKTATETEIQQAIRLVAGGGAAILQPEVQKAVVSSYQRPLPPPPGPVDALSDRELEILRTLAHDLTNKEIAARLGISDRTVQQHLANITSKLGVASRTGAVLKALQLGMISLEDLRV
ncbi:MAG: two component transcriptional regulator, LuxR family [Cyanobacteria bacterium RYN_339]|nr:two component transcriptional regulator, LuxR family [Cyanobacteria bacterium RYN_339]